MPDLRITRRRLPHWELEGSTYFVTFRLIGSILTAPERRIVLEHIIAGHGRFYTLIAATVMPDHAHVLIEPKAGVALSRIMKGTKGASSRAVNKARGEHGSLWQEESFDRIVRDQQELDEKLHYMLNNAAKRGLVEDPWLYDGWFFNRAVAEKW